MRWRCNEAQRTLGVTKGSKNGPHPDRSIISLGETIMEEAVRVELRSQSDTFNIHCYSIQPDRKSDNIVRMFCLGRRVNNRIINFTDAREGKGFMISDNGGYESALRI